MTREEVLRFWFPAPACGLPALAANHRRWFAGGPGLDQEIGERFGEAIEHAGQGELAHWTRTAPGRLALILLLDQFPRNAFRGTARAYAWDALAVACCLEGLREGADVRLAPVERLFFYLPLLHSEEGQHQELSVLYTDALSRAVGAAEHDYFAGWRRVARRQRVILRCFGRFPHRNVALGRSSTAAERVLFAAIRLRRLLMAPHAPSESCEADPGAAEQTKRSQQSRSDATVAQGDR